MVLKSFAGGLRRVLASPLIVVAAMVAMLLVTAPFALVVGSELQTALSNQPHIDRDAGEIDPEWWFEYREHASGLTATFTPVIIGFAAPLSNLSALLDGVWLLALTWTLGAWLQVPLAFWYAVLAVVLALAVLQARRAPGSPWLLRGRPWHNAGVVVGLPLKLLLLVWIVARL